MENNFKRFLSLLLAFVMVFGMFPANVFAAGDETADEFHTDDSIVDAEPLAEGDPVAMIGETGYTTLADAIAAVQNGETIELLADIYDDVTIAQQKNVAFTIDGMKQTATADTLSENEETINSNFYTCYGTLSINGTSYAGNQNQGLTIKNLNFVVDGYGIQTPGKTYPRNITIEDCSFTGTDGDNADYGIYLRYAYNINVKDCTADNLAYMISSAQALTGFTAENLTIKNTNTGIRFVFVNSTALIKNVVIEDAEVGVEIRNQATGTVTFEGCTIEADTNLKLTQVTNVTKVTKIAFAGENTMICTGENWLVNDTPDYFTVNYDGDGDENSNVTIVTIVAMIGETGYTSFDAAYAAAVAGEGDTITLLAPVTVTADTTYDLSGLTVESAGDAFVINAGTLTLNGNGVVKAGTAADDSYCAVWADGGNAVINGGTYSVGGDSTTTDTTHQNDAIYTKNGGTVKIYGGTFLNDGTVWTLNENDANRGTITVYGGTFQNWNPADNVSEGAGTSFLAEGYKSVESGDGYWTVTEVTYAAQIGATKYETLADAIAAAASGDTITLLTDVNESVTVNKSVTIEGAECSYTGKMSVTATASITVQNVDFVAGCIDKASGSGSVTIKSCDFDGQGLNSYALNLRTGSKNIIIEDCTVKNYGYGFLQTPKASGHVTVKNVTVENVNYGFKIDYSSGVTMENVTVKDAGYYGIYDSNYGTKTYTITNCSFSGKNPIQMWERNTTVVDTFKFYGANTLSGDDVAQSALAKFVLADVNATLTAPEGLTVITDVGENYKVVHENGVYKVADVVYVAQIGETKYETLAEAIAAVKDGETITLLKDNAENVTIKQVAGLSFTIDGAGKTYSGEITIDGNKRYTYSESLTIKNINFVTDKTSHIFIDADYSADGSTKMGNAHNITVENCTFTGPEGSNTVQGMRVRSGNKITFTGCTATNVMYLVQSTSAGNMLTVKDCSITAGYGIRVHNGNNALIQNVTLNTANMGIIFDGGQTRTATIENVTITGEGTPIYLNKATAGTQTLVMKGTNNIDGNWFTISGTGSTIVVDLTDDATLDIANVTYDTSYYGVETEGKVHTISKFEAVAKIGETGYATLAAAIAAVKDGETITLLKDNAENVTIKQVAGLSFTIDGANFVYSGTIKVDGNHRPFGEESLTIKNVRFIKTDATGYATFIDAQHNEDGGNNEVHNLTVENCHFESNNWHYAIYTRHPYNLVVKNCTAEKVYYFIYNPQGGETITVENCTVTNATYGIGAQKATDVTVKNYTYTGKAAGFYGRANSIGSVAVLENVNITTTLSGQSAVTLWKNNDGTTSKLYAIEFVGTNVLTTPEGTASFAAQSASNSPYTIKLNQLDATVKATEGLEITTDLAGHKVVYKDGVYLIGELNYVAEVNGVKYESIQAAIDAAVDGDTVVLLKDVELDNDDVIKTTTGRTTLIAVEGKAITMDMAGYAINVKYSSTTEPLFAVVYVANEAGLTITGDGKLDLLQEGVVGDYDSVYYMFWMNGTSQYLTIENGYFHANNLEDSMVYTNGDEIVTVKGGTFILDSTGTEENGFPWIFNTQGQNARQITVTGGTYNVDVGEQFWVGEVYIPDGYICEDNGDGTWTVHEGKFVAQITETGKKYATLEAAIAAVQNGETIVLLTDNDEDVTIKQVAGLSFTIDGAEKTYTGTIKVDGNKRYTGAETLTIQNVNFVVEGTAIDAVKNTYVHNITVDSCTFTGTDGDNYDYGIYLRHSYDITVRNTEGTNLFDLVYGNSSVTGFIAENVTVTDSFNGIWLSYVNSTADFKNVTTTVENAGIGFYTYASGTATFEDCAIDKVVYNNSRGTASMKMVFNDQENNLAIGATGERLTAVLNQVDATLTAREGLNVIPSEELAKSYAVVYENGVYRLGKIIARNEQTGKLYMDLSDGLDEAVSGQTVTLLAETAEDLVLVGAGVTLDLNGHVVEAKNALSFGVVMDTAETVGGIKIDSDTTKAFTKLQPENGGYLPIYDSANGMYKFFQYKELVAIMRDGDNTNQMKVGVKLKFYNSAAYELLCVKENASSIDVRLRLWWTGQSTDYDINYSFEADTIVKYAKKYAANPEATSAMVLTISGLDGLAEGGVITAKPSVTNNTEVLITADEQTYTKVSTAE